MEPGDRMAENMRWKAQRARTKNSRFPEPKTSNIEDKKLEELYLRVNHNTSKLSDFSDEDIPRLAVLLNRPMCPFPGDQKVHDSLTRSCIAKMLIASNEKAMCALPSIIKFIDGHRNSVDDSYWLVRDLIQLIGKNGPKAVCAIPVLIECTNDKNDSVRSAAAQILEQMFNTIKTEMTLKMKRLQLQDELKSVENQLGKTQNW
jgi:hypothetical protein